MAKQSLTRSHVAGLDTLRFVAAAWVALSHGARPPLAEIAPTGDKIFALLATLNNGLFNGVASVMMFFVISGFVIHRPNVGVTKLDIPLHYARRLTRILPPVLVAAALCAPFRADYIEGLGKVLWSIYCEIGYYAMYPVLFALMRRFGAEKLFFVATAFSIACIADNATILYHHHLRLFDLVMIGLPSWLLGCALAERKTGAALAADPGARIWLWRLGAIALSAALKLPVGHGPVQIGYPATHWIFAIYAFHWISCEIDWFEHHKPWKWCERAGAKSYSLYLVHAPIIVFFGLNGLWPEPLGGVLGHAPRAWLIAWAMMLPTIWLATWAFYRWVELPSHRLARTFTRVAARAQAA